VAHERAGQAVTLASELDCGPCRLRPWRAADRPMLLRYADNRRIWLNLRDRFPNPYGPAEADAWLGFAAATPAPEGVWAIEFQGEAIGTLGIERGQDVERASAEIGYWLAEPFWGRGLMTAVVAVASEHALSLPDLYRLHAPVFAWNTASMRVLEKAGYEREGILRRSGVKDGQLVDRVVYARTRNPGLPYVRADS
jgi:ribosomal-protein-alanine N-acetyltransferase